MALLDRILGFKGEPEYVRTASSDGRKYIDLDDFLKDDKVRQQLNLERLTETNGSAEQDGSEQHDASDREQPQG